MISGQDLSLVRQAELLQVSHSSLYSEPRSVPAAELMRNCEPQLSWASGCSAICCAAPSGSTAKHHQRTRHSSQQREPIRHHDPGRISLAADSIWTTMSLRTARFVQFVVRTSPASRLPHAPWRRGWRPRCRPPRAPPSGSAFPRADMAKTHRPLPTPPYTGSELAWTGRMVNARPPVGSRRKWSEAWPRATLRGGLGDGQYNHFVRYAPEKILWGCPALC